MSANQKQKEKKRQSLQDHLAKNNGLAIVVIDEDSPALTKSNNNSICHVLYNSEEFAPECAKFCGKAFEMATEAGKTVEYKCYAGLNCLAVPVKTETKQLVAIVGRTFLKAEDYRSATERAIFGDWRKFPLTEFFENVLLSGSMRNLEAAAKRLENLSGEEKDALLQIIEEPQTIKEPKIAGRTIVESKTSENLNSEIQSAFIVCDEISSENTKRHVSRFCQTVALELEILRLREELNRRGCVERAVQKFNESVKDTDTDDFWSSLVQICAELMRAERSSLLVFDEKSNSLSAKAATGIRADIIKKERENLGERIARKVLQNGKPLVVEDVRKTEISAAPVEWNYKSSLFISYPILIGQRKIGVLNVTDRAEGENFSELDLEILNAVMPQLAVLMDSAVLKDKMGEFAQLSVTDSLTGLLNRLYLDERLPEEIRRSNREGFPMSFLMIDVDDFKSYNDNFGHAEGDKALKLVAHCLKDTLRGADVAARYGGEEFSILLPQTTSDEAKTIGERIREKVASTEFPNRQVTISVGVASCSNIICTAREIIKWADDALYEAKRRGRNNVQVYENL